MNAANEIAIYLLQTFLSLFMFAALLRFLLQVVKADFYNPISQFIVKVTDPAIIPLRKIVPSVGGYDLASVVLVVLVQMAGLLLIVMLYGAAFPNPVLLIIWSILGVLSMLLQAYFFILLATIIVGWVAPGSRHPVVILLHQISEPVMAPVRRVVPPLGGLDFSPIVIFIGINIAQILLRNIATSVGLHPGLLFGF